MSKMVLNTQKKQYVILAVTVIIVIVLTVLLGYSENNPFQRFLGNLNPILVLSISSVLGSVFLLVLKFKSWFDIYKQKDQKLLFLYLALIPLFVIIAILVDVKYGFPKGINVAFPEALIFYPVIAFFVEMVFHILPLSIILLIFSLIVKGSPNNKFIYTSIIIVAMFEPSYQIWFMDKHSIWALVVVWINLFFFNIYQLYIFKKFDFISMFVFRLFYYFIWHILWGYLRLKLLF